MFPEDKPVLKIKTKGLPNLVENSDETFEFCVEVQEDGFYLEIPPVPVGSDYATPVSTEQESWVRNIAKDYEVGFKEVWYCIWEIKSEIILESFLKIIEPNIAEKEYYKNKY